MRIINTDLAKNPLNWIVVALMMILFLFVLAPMVALFTSAQNGLTAQGTKVV